VRRTIVLIMIGVLLGAAVPAMAVTAWSARARSATGVSTDTYAKSSIGWTEASVGRTVNKVDGIRVEVRTTDGVAAKVSVYASALCANGSSTSEDRTLTTKADKAWTTLTLYKPTDRKRGQCVIDASVADWYGTKGSPLEVRILTTTY
jgi:hypothetical protein